MPPHELTLAEKLQRFVRKWQELIHDDIVTEQSSAQSFLNDLKAFYGVDLPPGKIFEQHPYKIRKPTNGGLFGDQPTVEYDQGRMDLYLPDICVWEMKGPKEDLAKHTKQAFDYWVPMQTRYVVLCNFREFWVFDTSKRGGTREPAFVLKLEDLPAHPEALLFLRGEEAQIELHSERITREVAGYIGNVIRSKVQQAKDEAQARQRLTKFAMECVFAMFGEDSELLPPRVFTVAMDKAREIGDLSPVYTLFQDFDHEDPDRRFNPELPYINGPLFDSDYPPVHLEPEFLEHMYFAARDYNWQEVRPEVFGSIFEQALSPYTRHELGAHFTAHNDIMKVVGPTVVRPWQERINACRTHRDCEALLERLRHYHVLDPACGCGNFLYVVYREMKRLEFALLREWEKLHNQRLKRADRRTAPPGPYFTIQQLHGIDKQEWAVTLTKVELWIAEHLANRELSLNESTLPLKDLGEQIICADALFTDWFRPPDDGVSELAIVGNPPYLGNRKMRQEFGNDYVDKLRKRFPKNSNADYVTHWFPVALQTLRQGERAGFVTTNSICQNENREASIDLISANGHTVYEAWKSFPWPGEAAVYVSITNWITGDFGGVRYLDGSLVKEISPYFTQHTDLSRAHKLNSNCDICFQGVIPKNPSFVISIEEADKLIEIDRNSLNVLKPFLVGQDLNRHPMQQAARVIIDFQNMGLGPATRYEVVFDYLHSRIHPTLTEEQQRDPDFRWWVMHRYRGEMRQAIKRLHSFLVISRVAPLPFFTFQEHPVLPDNAVVVIALDQYYHYAILQSAIHEYWAWARGSTLKGDLRYTNTTIFETFPFPLLDSGRGAIHGSQGTGRGATCGSQDSGRGGTRAAQSARRGAIHGSQGRTSAAPTDIKRKYDPRVVPDTPEAARVSRVAEKLYEKRQAACKTLNLGLTKLYNLIKGKTALSTLKPEHRAPVEELQALHEELNNAVCACYGWPEDTWRDENEVLKRLLELNLALTQEEGIV